MEEIAEKRAQVLQHKLITKPGGFPFASTKKRSPPFLKLFEINKKFILYSSLS